MHLLAYFGFTDITVLSECAGIAGIGRARMQDNVMQEEFKYVLEVTVRKLT